MTADRSKERVAGQDDEADTEHRSRRDPEGAFADAAAGAGDETRRSDAGDEAASDAPGGDPTRGGDDDAFQDRYLRLAAEFDNYRKRTERERSEAWIRAQADLVKKILDPLDDLQRVADFTVESTGVEALLEGVQMVERKLLRALENAGMEVIDATGQPFDPALHEALMAAPTDDPAEDESVGAVFQKGYGFKGILLRPARVQVRKHEG